MGDWTNTRSEIVEKDKCVKRYFIPNTVGPEGQYLMSVRLATILHREKILYWEDVAAMSRREFRELYGVGHLTMKEAEAALALLGLTFAVSRPPDRRVYILC